MITVDETMIEAAKVARRLTTDAFNFQIKTLLEAALMDMGVAGVEVPEEMDALVQQAAITYFLMHFGEPDDYARLKSSYDEQKAQLATATGYTKWSS